MEYILCSRNFAPCVISLNSHNNPVGRYYHCFNFTIEHTEALKEWKSLARGHRAKCKSCSTGTSLVVQWLRFCASNAGGAGSTPDWKTKIWCTAGQVSPPTTTASSPCFPQGQKSLHSNKDPAQSKIIFFLFKESIRVDPLFLSKI